VVPELRSLGRIVQKAMGVRARRLEAERLAREAKAAKAQAEYAALLDRLVQEAPQVWQEIDSTVERGTGGAYEKAFQLLQTLAEAFRRADREADFRHGLVRLLERHGRRPAWIKRLEKAGFI
jgi:hypothetical protein